MYGKADVDYASYGRSGTVDGATPDRFERHIANIYKALQKLKIVIRNKEDLRRHRETLNSIKFFYFRGF